MTEQTPCARVRDLVSSAPERADELPGTLGSHVEGCAACQVEVEASRRLAHMLGSAHSALSVDFSAEHVLARAKTPKERARPRRLWVPLALAGAAAATVAVLVSTPGPSEPAGETPRAEAGAAPSVAPTPEVREEQPGLEIVTCEVVDLLHGGEAKPCVKPSKWTVTTGATERARIVLSDQTTVDLNRQGELSLTPGHARGLTVARGEILVDVVKQAPLPPLEIVLPTGMVEVVGTKLAVSVHETMGVVDVVRGKVLAHAMGESAAVVAGDEALLVEGKPPVVQAAADVSAATAWAEQDTLASTSDSGFGTLTARKPGDKADTERALRLVRHEIDVRIQGRVARTVVEEEFANDADDTLEGVYTFPLPAGARIAGLELEVDGRWEVGAIVERERADKIWQGVIRNATPKRERRRDVEWIWVPGPWKDPALLNWKKGNSFELRIFPIPGKGSRKVRIAYTETLPAIPGGRRYTYPMPAARGDEGGEVVSAERFRFDAKVGSAPEVRVGPYRMDVEKTEGGMAVSAEAERFVPMGDIVIDVPDPDAGRELVSYAYGDGEEAWAMLALRPDLPTRRSEGALDVVFVVDRSYSIQAARLDRAAKIVAGVTANLPAGSNVQVLACAARCEALREHAGAPSGALAARLATAISSLEPLGSTRLSNAFGEAGRWLRQNARGGERRVVYLGDGVPSVGELEPERLSKQAAMSVGQARIVTVSLGGETDDVMMRALARAGEGSSVRHGAADSAAGTAFEVLRRLWSQPLEDVELTLPEGASEVAPQTLGTMWPGEERLVALRLAGDTRGEVVLKGRLAGREWQRRYKVSWAPRKDPGNAFLPRLWAERRIDALSVSDDSEAARAQIVALSTKHHVLSRHTSLLVLESPAMARAFKVESTRPEVEWTGEEETSADATDSEETRETRGKREKAKQAGRRSNALKDLDAIGDGHGADLVNDSAMGSTAGAGGLSGSAKRERKVRARVKSAPPRAMASGSVDRATIHRVIRRNQSQLRRVYESQLKSNPNLGGRINVKITIGANGRVVKVEAGNHPLARAVEQVVRRWRFPPPGDGNLVTVQWPIVFSAAGGGSTSSAAPPGRPGRWVPMKKVWFREGAVSAAKGVSGLDERRLEQREEALREQPLSRERTRDLVRAYIRTGRLDAARELATAWLDKDRMDGEALVILAELAALDGDPGRSRELLASAVDVAPDSQEAHARMITVYIGEGDVEMRCAHALTRALMAPRERELAVAAARCGADAERVFAGLKKRDRRKATRAAKKDGKGPRKSDRLTLKASWEGGADLDVVVVSPRGRVLSWLGGAKRVGAHDVRSTKEERLALSAEELGSYRVFVVPKGGAAGTRVAGKVRLSAYGKARTLRFEVDAGGGATAVGEMSVKARWRHEQVGGGTWNPR